MQGIIETPSDIGFRPVTSPSAESSGPNGSSESIVDLILEKINRVIPCLRCKEWLELYKIIQ